MDTPVFLQASEILARIGATAFGSGFIASADAAAGRSALGLIIGTNVQAYSANLAALSALTVGTGANNLVQLTAASKLPAVDGSLLTNLPASGLAADGSVTGATSQRQVFTNGITGPSWRPASNSTTALQMQNAAGTAFVNGDTTNGTLIATSLGTASTNVPLRVLLASGQTGNAFEIRDSSNVLLTRFNGFSGSLYLNAASAEINVGVGGSPVIYLDNKKVAQASGTQVNLASGFATAIIQVDTTISRITSGLNDVVPFVNLWRSTSGGAGSIAAGFGGSLLFGLQTSLTLIYTAASIKSTWIDPTEATRKGRIVLSAWDSAEREGMRIDASGSAAKIGFFGASAIVRPTITGSRGANAALADLLTQMANYGLITDGTTV